MSLFVSHHKTEFFPYEYEPNIGKKVAVDIFRSITMTYLIKFIRIKFLYLIQNSVQQDQKSVAVFV